MFRILIVNSVSHMSHNVSFCRKENTTWCGVLTRDCGSLTLERGMMRRNIRNNQLNYTHNNIKRLYFLFVSFAYIMSDVSSWKSRCIACILIYIYEYLIARELKRDGWLLSNLCSQWTNRSMLSDISHHDSQSGTSWQKHGYRVDEKRPLMLVYSSD